MLCLVLYNCVPLIYAFSCALAFGQCVDLDLVVQAYVHTPKSQQRGWISPSMHVCVLLHMFMFGSMLVCLDLGPCHVLVCFPLMGLCLLVFGANCLFGCICFLWQLVCLHLSDVWFACHLPFSPLLSLACQGFSCQPFYVTFNMTSSPLCVITCLAPFLFALCHLVWPSLSVCILVYLFTHV